MRKKYLFALILLSPLILSDTKMYLSCEKITMGLGDIIKPSKLWIYINKDKKEFNVFTEESIISEEDAEMGIKYDLTETSTMYNRLDRTTLLYHSATPPYQCKVSSREILELEKKNFLRKFLANRKL